MLRGGPTKTHQNNICGTSKVCEEGGDQQAGESMWGGVSDKNNNLCGTLYLRGLRIGIRGQQEVCSGEHGCEDLMWGCTRGGTTCLTLPV